MKSKLLKISKRPFIRNVIIMVTGTAAAQLVTIALSPIITRLYGPESYGLMGVFMAIIAMFVPISALTYPIAIVLPRSDKDAKGIIRLSLYISTGIAVVVGIFLLLFKNQIVSMFQLEKIAPFLYLIPLVILFSGLSQVTEQWLIRKRQFGINAKVTFLQSLILNGGKVSFGIFSPIAAVLIVLSALGSGLKALMMIFFIKISKPVDSNHVSNSQLTIRELAKKHKDFPIFRAPQSLVYVITQSLPVLLLTSFFGPVSAGFYSLGKSVMNAPTQLIGKAVGDVFYPRISEAGSRGENIADLILKATLSLALIGIIPFGIVIAFGPLIFSFVFGSEWLTAGEYARWISLFVLFNFIHQPSVKALPVLSAQAFHLKFTLLTLVVNISSLATGYYLFSSDEIAIAFFGISSAVLSSILIIITLQISKRFNKNK